MSGKNSRLKALASRKHLLIAESDLNRAQLIQEWQTMAGQVHALARQAKTLSAMASAAGLLVAGISAFRHKGTASSSEKPSWWQSLLKGSGVVSSIWSAFGSRSKS
jgi:hypothetical protein